MAWILRVTVAASAGEAASSRLWDLHTTGIAETPLEPAGPADRALVELLAGFGTREAAEAASRELGLGGRVEAVDERAWVDPDRRAVVGLGPEGAPVEIDVAGAFGDGGHPTTRLALALVARSTRPGMSVLDVGTGTGVLALAALAAGAGRVVAVDNDPDALAVAGRNLARLHTGPGGWELADTVPAGAFDLVVANLVLGTQRELAATVAGAVVGGGTLALSGLLADQEAHALALFPCFAPVERRTDGDWLGLALRAPQ